MRLEFSEKEMFFMWSAYHNRNGHEYYSETYNERKTLENFLYRKNYKQVRQTKKLFVLLHCISTSESASDSISNGDLTEDEHKSLCKKLKQAYIN
tara:strand:- start:40 stop:324 length:285 start_codon:yes stop_codon:yes gene_type:complete